MPALFYGLIASMFALILQLLVWIPYPNLFTFQSVFTVHTLIALILLALCEEIARLLFFTQYALRYTLVAPLQNGLVFGLGFALTEGILALYHPFSFLIFGVAGLHMALSILLAFAAQKYLWRPSRRAFYGLSFAGLVLLHLGYNIAIFFLT